MDNNINNETAATEYISALVKRTVGNDADRACFETAEEAYNRSLERYNEISGISFERFAAHNINRALAEAEYGTANRAVECDELVEKYESSLDNCGLALDKTHKFTPPTHGERVLFAKASILIYENRELMKAFRDRRKIPYSYIAKKLFVQKTLFKRYSAYLKMLLLALDSELSIPRSYIGQMAASAAPTRPRGIVLAIADRCAYVFNSSLEVRRITADDTVFVGANISLDDSEYLEPPNKKIFDEKSLIAVFAALVASLSAVFFVLSKMDQI